MEDATPFHHGRNPLSFASPPDKLVVRELAFETRRTSAYRSPRNRFLSSLSRGLNGIRIDADEREREREKVKKIREGVDSKGWRRRRGLLRRMMKKM